MATLVNDGNINFNGNWQTTGDVDVLHASTNLNVDSTTTQYSGYWTGNAANTDRGCLAYLATLTTPATARTITVTLQSDDATDFVGATDEQTATYVTASGTKLLTWIYFKLSSTEAENGSLYYRYKFVTDNAADTGFRADNAATTKVAIVQVLDATATVAATDVIYVVGAGTQTSGNPDVATVTYNVETGAGTGGDDGQGVGNIFIGNGGVLRFATTASKNYYLEVVGNIDILNGGEFDVGTVATPMPSTSTATLEMNDTSADRDIIVRAGAKLIMQGAAFTGNVWRTTLSVTSAASDTTLDTVANTQTAGWKADDVLIVSTTSGAGNTEEVVVSSISGTTITIDDPGVVNQHLSGAEVCNLTRNVVVTSTAATNDVYIPVYDTTLGNVDFDYVQFKNINHPDVNLSLIYTAASSTKYNIDYCSFDTVRRCFKLTSQITTDLSFSNILIWGNFTYNTGCIGIANTYGSGAGAWGNVKISDSTIAGISNNGSDVGFIGVNAVILFLENVNIYDASGGAQAGNAFSGLSNTILYLINVKIWTMFSVLRKTYGAAPLSTKIRGYNCIFGGDGTNTVANGNDILTCQFSDFIFWNTKFLSDPEVSISQTGAAFAINDVIIQSHNHNATQYRYKTWQSYGIISDQITGGQAEAWARGGSGLCVYLSPSSSTSGNTLNWEFNVPVTAATSFTLSFYHRITASFNGSATVTIYDSDDNITELLSAEAVSFTDDGDWHEYTSTACVPTDTGFCRVVVKALDGGTTGDIGIDDVHTT